MRKRRFTEVLIKEQEVAERENLAASAFEQLVSGPNGEQSAVNLPKRFTRGISDKLKEKN